MMEQFKRAAGIDIHDVPYKTVSQISLAVLAGEIGVDLGTASAYSAFVTKGKVRPLATLSEERSLAFPDVPTATELGLPIVTPGFSGGFWMPAGSPPEAVKVIHQAVAEAVAQPDIKALFIKSGAEPFSSTPAEFAKAVNTEVAYWRKAAKDFGYVPE